MSSSATKSRYAGYRFPAEVISQAVWLYFRFPLSLRMVEEMLAARGIVVSHETVRQWALRFGQDFANRIRRRLPCARDKWHLDEVAIRIAGVQHWLWRAVDQNGMVLDVLVQSRRDKRAAKRLLRKLLKRQCRAPKWRKPISEFMTKNIFCLYLRFLHPEGAVERMHASCINPGSSACVAYLFSARSLPSGLRSGEPQRTRPVRAAGRTRRA